MSKVRWDSCNVIELKPDVRHLWKFGAGSDAIKPDGDFTCGKGQALPAEVVRKDWRALWHKKLNVAWLPEGSVFLRVLELPVADEAETLSMVELQLEKISPIPVTQIVWSFESLPKRNDKFQALIVIIAARSAVEEHLGRLEADGYLTDRLELPLLHQLLSFTPDGDSVYLHLKPGHASTLCLAGWWCGGHLRNLTLCQLPLGEAGPLALARMLTQSAWAGEAEGWLTASPKWKLVATADVSADWAAKLGELLVDKVEVLDAPKDALLAAAAARHAVSGNGMAGLLPAEFTLRYRQKFVDGLWMKFVGALLALYTLGVVAYLGAVQVLSFKQRGVAGDVKALSANYTNAMQLHANVQVLQEQANLRFAALDCWKAVSEYFPEDMTLTSFVVANGRKLTLVGYTDAGNISKIGEYNLALRNATNSAGKLFASVSPPSVDQRPGPAGPQTATWRFDCDLNTKEAE